MKLVFALAIFATSSIGLACPSFNGSFTCSDSQGNPTDPMTMTTAVTNGQTVYTFDGQAITADGTQQTAQADDGTPITFSLSCSDSGVVLNFVTTTNQMLCQDGSNVTETAQTIYSPLGTGISIAEQLVLSCGTQQSDPLTGFETCVPARATPAHAKSFAQKLKARTHSLR